MTSLGVVDASSIVPFFLDEPFSALSHQLVGATGSHGLLVAPPHFFAEVSNAVYQRLRRGDIQPSLFDRVTHDLPFLPVLVFNPPDLYQLAGYLATRHGLTSTYDAVYLALAEKLNLPFWTADEKLIRQTAAELPYVRHIETFAAGGTP